MKVPMIRPRAERARKRRTSGKGEEKANELKGAFMFWSDDSVYVSC